MSLGTQPGFSQAIHSLATDPVSGLNELLLSKPTANSRDELKPTVAQSMILDLDVAGGRGVDTPLVLWVSSLLLILLYHFSSTKLQDREFLPLWLMT